MPMYEYQCEKCGHAFARNEHVGEHEKARPSCPKCKGRRVHQVFSSFFAKTSKKS